MIGKLCIVGVLSCATAQGQLSAPPNAAKLATPLAFDAISIHPSKSGVTTNNQGVTIVRTTVRTSPDGYFVENAKLEFIISTAYGIKEDSISGGPEWINSSRFDINAKVVSPDGTAAPGITSSERQQMLRALLADRFHLAVHNETKDADIYELEIAKGGSKLPVTTPGDTFTAGVNGPDGNPAPAGFLMPAGVGRYIGQAISLASLADRLSEQLHQPVIDKTGLTGKYDISLSWTPDMVAAAENASSGASGPSIFTALSEQLGLKLIPAKGSVTTLVIDRIGRPTEN
jgi:uncharacterized protein (TIGR03435 family)